MSSLDPNRYFRIDIDKILSGESEVPNDRPAKKPKKVVGTKRKADEQPAKDKENQEPGTATSSEHTENSAIKDAAVLVLKATAINQKYKLEEANVALEVAKTNREAIEHQVKVTLEQELTKRVQEEETTKRTQLREEAQTKRAQIDLVCAEANLKVAEFNLEAKKLDLEIRKLDASLRRQAPVDRTYVGGQYNWHGPG